MQNCIQCGNKNPDKTNPQGRERKYCSKKCAQKFYTQQGRYNKHKKPGSDWGTITAKRIQERKAEQKKRHQEFEWYSQNWMTAQQVAEILKKTPSAVHARGKAHNILPKVVSGPEAPTAFWSPEAVDKMIAIDQPSQLPEGYINRHEVQRMLGISKGTFQTNYTGRIKPDMIWQQTHHHRSTQHLYLKTNIVKFINERSDAIEAKRLAKLKREEERLQQVAARAAHRAAASAQRRLERDREREARNIERERKKAENAERRRRKYLEKRPKADYDWQSMEVREQRLFNRFPLLLEKYSNDTREYTQHYNAIAANKRLKRLHEAGIVTKFVCKQCDVEQPYYEFYYERTASCGRRLSRCRTCESKRNKKRYALHKESDKERRRLNYRGKFRTLIAQTIKQDMSGHRGVYVADISTASVWSKIEEKCGYDIDQFIEHIENQFDENMNWLNHGRGTDQYYWQIDHIVPRSKFIYTSLDDSAFVECWSLDNLQPLSQYDNLIKDSPWKGAKEKFLAKKEKNNFDLQNKNCPGSAK